MRIQRSGGNHTRRTLYAHFVFLRRQLARSNTAAKGIAGHDGKVDVPSDGASFTDKDARETLNARLVVVEDQLGVPYSSGSSADPPYVVLPRLRSVRACSCGSRKSDATCTNTYEFREEGSRKDVKDDIR